MLYAEARKLAVKKQAASTAITLGLMAGFAITPGGIQAPRRLAGAEAHEVSCRSLAEMPVRRVEISDTARNHILNGFLIF